jgi:chromosome segregation ATPase
VSGVGQRTESPRAEVRSGRSSAADGEHRPMAQTAQAWDWRVELRDEERSELELLRRTMAQLHTQLDQAHDSLRTCRERQKEVSEALRQLDEAGPWRRRRVRRALRDRQLL